jgi:hypothetical protein
MNRPAAIPASLTTEPSQSAHAERPIMPWVLAAVAVVIACAALVIDSSLTPSERSELFMQSGTFP